MKIKINCLVELIPILKKNLEFLSYEEVDDIAKILWKKTEAILTTVLVALLARNTELTVSLPSI